MFAYCGCRFSHFHTKLSNFFSSLHIFTLLEYKVKYDFVHRVTFSSAKCYLVLHAILIMVQATTLNVAFNSHNKSLLTIMMSNNVGIISTCVYNSTLLSAHFCLISDILSISVFFFLSCSLWKLKEVSLRSLKRTTCFKCQTAVGVETNPKQLNIGQ